MNDVLPGQISLLDDVPQAELYDLAEVAQKMRKEIEVANCRALFAIERAEALKKPTPADPKFVFGGVPKEVEVDEGQVQALCQTAQYLRLALSELTKICPEE